MVTARQQEIIMDPQQLIPAQKGISFMEEITYENAKMMVIGLGKSHAVEDVSHRMQGSHERMTFLNNINVCI